MRLRNVLHKGLRRFVEHGETAGLSPSSIERLRNMLTFMQEMASLEELRAMPGWRLHPLTGSQKGRWSLTVTKNWRLTFSVDQRRQEIFDIDFEDYH